MTARRSLQWSDGAAGPVLDRSERTPACATADPELFFAATLAEIGRAKAICAGCPVRLRCRLAALADPTLEGVWGGTTGEERAVMRGTLRPVREAPRKPARKSAPRGTHAERREHARAVLEAGEKPCAGPCGKVKPLDGFSRRAKSLDGRQSRCKACQKANEARRRGEPAGRLPVAA